MRRNPLTLALLAALAASPVLAQTAPEETPDETALLDAVIVTGTRVADRTVAESTAPIDILTPEALTATGTPELATALSRALPSLNFPRPAINDGTDTVRPAQLRGLSPDHVLVLVNGKRYHPGSLVNVNGSQGRSSSPVDLNTIPISAISRVEVLRDGASAQYGSDAIAGVINIVLKGSDSGGSVNARYGIATQSIFGLWSPWQVVPFASTQPAPDPVQIVDARLVPRDPGPPVSVCQTELQIEFVVDWRARRVASVSFRGKLFAAATRADDAPPGMPGNLQTSLAGASRALTVTFAGNTPSVVGAAIVGGGVLVSPRLRQIGMHREGGFDAGHPLGMECTRRRVAAGLFQLHLVQLFGIGLETRGFIGLDGFLPLA